MPRSSVSTLWNNSGGQNIFAGRRDRVFSYSYTRNTLQSMRAACARSSGSGVVTSNSSCMSVLGMGIARDEDCMILAIFDVIDQAHVQTRRTGELPAWRAQENPRPAHTDPLVPDASPHAPRCTSAQGIRATRSKSLGRKYCQPMTQSLSPTANSGCADPDSIAHPERTYGSGFRNADTLLT